MVRNSITRISVVSTSFETFLSRRNLSWQAKTLESYTIRTEHYGIHKKNTKEFMGVEDEHEFNSLKPNGNYISQKS
jgi:hypothetical protein